MYAQFLPVQDVHGNIIGRLMLEHTYVDFLRRNTMGLGVVQQGEKIVGYTLSTEKSSGPEDRKEPG